MAMSDQLCPWPSLIEMAASESATITNMSASVKLWVVNFKNWKHINKRINGKGGVMRRLENQPCLNFKMEARQTQGSAKHQFLSGTLHWFAIRDNVSISPITAEQPVGQQSGCWACAHRAWQHFHALIAAVQLRVGLALGHTISTVIDWQGVHEEKQQDGVSPTNPGEEAEPLQCSL